MTKESFLQYLRRFLFKALRRKLVSFKRVERRSASTKKMLAFFRRAAFFMRVAIFYVEAAWQQQNKFVLEPNFLFVSDHMRQIKQSFSRFFLLFFLLCKFLCEVVKTIKPSNKWAISI